PPIYTLFPYTTLFRSTGLGLSTVFASVQQSGGHIEVSSAPGRGTTFEIYLPSSEQPAGKRTEAEPAPSSLGGSETILLVEDEARSEEHTSELQSRGHT